MNRPRAASTLLVVRDSPGGIQVVMGFRPPGGPFGAVWVFPGGSVDPDDIAAAADDDEAWRLAALRETWEEVGLAITDPEGHPVPDGDGSVHLRLAGSGACFASSRLVYLSNWVTPRIVSKRFDTRFYVVAAEGPLGSSPELATVDWVPARRAVELHARREFPIMFPTLSHLRYICRFERVDELIDEARSLDVIPAVEPRRFERGEGIELVVDNDPRFRP